MCTLNLFRCSCIEDDYLYNTAGWKLVVVSKDLRRYILSHPENKPLHKQFHAPRSSQMTNFKINKIEYNISRILPAYSCVCLYRITYFILNHIVCFVRTFCTAAVTVQFFSNINYLKKRVLHLKKKDGKKRHNIIVLKFIHS